MERYKLNADEVTIFKEDCQLLDVVIDNVLQDKRGVILLTNQNIVFNFKTIQGQGSVVYPLSCVKIYQEEPQVTVNKTHHEKVEICLADDDLYITFENKKLAKQFVDELKKLLTGKSRYEIFLSKMKTGLSNVKRAIETVDETLGIDTMGIIQGIATSTAQKSPAGKVDKVAGVISTVGNIFGNKNKKTAPTHLPPDENSQ